VLIFSRRRRGVLILAMTALVLVTATGCFRYRGAAVIDETGTVSGSVIVAYSPDLIRAASELDGDPVADMRAFLEGNAAAVSTGQAVVRPYDADGLTGFETTFTDVATTDYLSLLRHEEQGGDTPDVLFELDRRDGDYVFSAELEPPKPGQMTLPAEAFEDAEITLSLTFPGPVSETNGEVSGTTVTWRPELPAPPPLEAVGKVAPETQKQEPAAGSSAAPAAATGDGGPGTGVLLGVGAAVVLLAAAAVAAVRWRRVRKE
jgi:hypothetical protein